MLQLSIIICYESRALNPTQVPVAAVKLVTSLLRRLSLHTIIKRNTRISPSRCKSSLGAEDLLRVCTHPESIVNSE